MEPIVSKVIFPVNEDPILLLMLPKEFYISLT